MDPRIEELFKGPNFAHLGTLLRDGAPHNAAIWITLRDGRLLVVKEPQAVSLANLRRDPRAAISINGVENPYLEAHVRGRAVDFREGQEATDLMNEMAEEYTGSRYPDPAPEVVRIEFEIDRAGFSDSGGMEHTPPGDRTHLPAEGHQFR